MLSRADTEKVVDVAMKQSKLLHEMYAQEAVEQTVREEIQKYMPQIILFMEKYFKPNSQL